jgi:23S rRNA pseudouridine1911/1915/1917 synthase
MDAVTSSPSPVAPGEHRALPVPDGLEGQRVDQALSRLFGLTRTVAAELADAGRVVVDGRARGKGDRLSGGSWLEVELPPPPGEPAAPQPVSGMAVVHDDDDIVVVDKPVGVAAHGSPGWDGPTVTGGLAAAGYRISTSGAAERQGIVHRLDAATTGLMVVAKSERAYTLLKAAFKERTVDKGYSALVQGHPDPSKGTIDAPIDRHPKHDWRFAVVSQIRVHFSALRHPCVGDMTYGADPTLAARLGVARQWLHAVRLGFAHPADGGWVEFTSEYPADLAGALAVLRAEN